MLSAVQVWQEVLKQLPPRADSIAQLESSAEVPRPSAECSGVQSTLCTEENGALLTTIAMPASLCSFMVCLGHLPVFQCQLAMHAGS